MRSDSDSSGRADDAAISSEPGVRLPHDSTSDEEMSPRRRRRSMMDSDMEIPGSSDYSKHRLDVVRAVHESSDNHIPQSIDIPHYIEMMLGGFLGNDNRPDTAPRLLPDYRSLPLHTDVDSQLGRVYIGYRDAALEMIADGTPAPSVLGPPGYVDFDLFFRDRSPEDGFTVSAFACELFKSMDGTQDLFTLMASVMHVTYLMRVRLSNSLIFNPLIPSRIFRPPSY